MIQRIGFGVASATSITIPAGHQVGDLLILFAFNSASTTIPTAAGGFNSINSGSGTATGRRMGFKIATSNAETSGTWTNATQLGVVVYRNIQNFIPPYKGAFSAGSNNGTTIPVTAITLTSPGKSSWHVWMLASVSSTLSALTPTGLTFLTSIGSAPDLAIFDSNGAVEPPITTQNITAGASSNNAFINFEVQSAQGFNNNYQSVIADSGMSVTERVR